MANALVLVVAAAIVPMLLFGLIITGVASGIVAWQPPSIWTDQFGTPNFQNGVTAMSVDSTGIYVGGYIGYSNIAYLHPSPSFIFLSRYDLNGHQLWVKQLGTVDSYVEAVAAGSGSVYVASSINGTNFIKKYDTSGNQVPFNVSSSVETNSISVVANGILTASSFSSRVREYDSSGSVIWSRVPENITAGSTPSVYATSTGFYASWTTGSGPVVAKYDLNANPVWTRSMEAPSAGEVAGDDTGVYVMGTYRVDVNWAGFIQRYDQNGNRQWSVQVAAPDYSSLSRSWISADSSGVYLAAQTSAGKQFLMKYDTNGNNQWSFQPPASNLLAIQAFGNALYVAGAVGVGYSRGPAFIAEYAQSSSLIFFWLKPSILVPAPSRNRGGHHSGSHLAAEKMG